MRTSTNGEAKARAAVQRRMESDAIMMLVNLTGSMEGQEINVICAWQRNGRLSSRRSTSRNVKKGSLNKGDDRQHIGGISSLL